LPIPDDEDLVRKFPSLYGKVAFGKCNTIGFIGPFPEEVIKTIGAFSHDSFEGAPLWLVLHSDGKVTLRKNVGLGT
jgi:hypothetical protein